MCESPSSAPSLLGDTDEKASESSIGIIDKPLKLSDTHVTFGINSNNTANDKNTSSKIEFDFSNLSKDIPRPSDTSSAKLKFVQSSGNFFKSPLNDYSDDNDDPTCLPYHFDNPGVCFDADKKCNISASENIFKKCDSANNHHDVNNFLEDQDFFENNFLSNNPFKNKNKKSGRKTNFKKSNNLNSHSNSNNNSNDVTNNLQSYDINLKKLSVNPDDMFGHTNNNTIDNVNSQLSSFELNEKDDVGNNLIFTDVDNNENEPKVIDPRLTEKPYTTGAEKILSILGFVSDEDYQKLETVNLQRFPTSSEISFDPNGKIIATSFSQLIIYLTLPEFSDIEVQSQFMISFLSFAEARTVLASLILRFFSNIQCPHCNVKKLDTLKIVRQRITRILSKWLLIAKYQFSPEMINAIEAFLQILSTQPSMDLQRRVIEASLNILKGLRVKNAILTTFTDCPEPIVPTGDPESWTISAIDPLEIARQLTLIHSEIFRKIDATEILDVIWRQCSRGSTAADGNIALLTQHFNHFSNFVTLTTLMSHQMRERVEMFLLWLQVADNCNKLHNFHGAFAVFTGLTHPAVNRMKKTVASALKKKSYKKMFANLSEICSFDDDYRVYRKEVANVIGPCVPFIGTIKKDLIYVQETYPNKIDELINFKKCVECVDLIKEISKFQDSRYHLLKNDRIQFMMSGIPPATDNTILMSMSLAKEPKK